MANIEEVLIRNDEGIVLSGIEVQKYLKRSAQGVPLRIFKCFTNELERLGYYTSDTLINASLRKNILFLATYPPKYRVLKVLLNKDLPMYSH